MEKFTIYTGTTVPLMNDNIDTDQILPKQFLKLIDKKGFGKYLMYAWRYKMTNTLRILILFLTDLNIVKQLF